MARHYGWIPQRPDFRDKLNSKPVVDKLALPQSVDLRPQCPPVYDQGQLGSCTANGIAGAIQYTALKTGYKWNFVPSRLFIYYNERVIEGTVSSDSGANIRDGISSINTSGVCPESEADGTAPDWLWPYDISQFTVKPPDKCYSDAVLHKSLKYEAVDLTNENQVLSVLAGGYPIVFGFSVPSSFESQEVATSGILPQPGLFDSIIGGHCVMAVGYNLNLPQGSQGIVEWVLCRNSWGAGWGLAGYFWMPLKMFLSSNWTSDGWVINLMEGEA